MQLLYDCLTCLLPQAWGPKTEKTNGLGRKSAYFFGCELAELVLVEGYLLGVLGEFDDGGLLVERVLGWLRLLRGAVGVHDEVGPRVVLGVHHVPLGWSLVGHCRVDPVHLLPVLLQRALLLLGKTTRGLEEGGTHLRLSAGEALLDPTTFNPKQ